MPSCKKRGYQWNPQFCASCWAFSSLSNCASRKMKEIRLQNDRIYKRETPEVRMREATRKYQLKEISWHHSSQLCPACVRLRLFPLCFCCFAQSQLWLPSVFAPWCRITRRRKRDTSKAQGKKKILTSVIRIKFDKILYFHSNFLVNQLWRRV